MGANRAIVKNVMASTNASPSTKSMTSSQPWRLSWEKMQSRGEKSPCFNCDEKFIPSHQCKVAQALVIEVDEPWDDEGETEPQISLNTISRVEIIYK